MQLWTLSDRVPSVVRATGGAARARLDGAKPHHRAYCEKHSQAHAERDAARGVPPAKVPPPPNMAPVTMPGGAGVGGLPAGSPLAASRAAAIAANPEAARATGGGGGDSKACARDAQRAASLCKGVLRRESIKRAPRARAFRAASHANGRGARGRGRGVPGNVARMSRRCDAGCAQAREIRAGEGETSSGRRGRRRGGRRSDERQRRGLGDHRGRWTMAETRAPKRRERLGASFGGRRGDDEAEADSLTPVSRELYLSRREAERQTRGCRRGGRTSQSRRRSDTRGRRSR